MTLTKAILIDRIHQANPDLTRNKVREAVETLLATMKLNLEQGNSLLLSGFGKFTVKSKSARKGRNPKTGQSLILAARQVVTFKPSGKLRDKINS